MKIQVTLFFSLALLHIIFLSCSINGCSRELTAVKSKWMHWAHELVKTERRKILSFYKVASADLRNEKVLAMLRASHDVYIERALTNPTMQEAIGVEGGKTVQDMVEALFVGSMCACVKVFHERSFNYGQVAVAQHYQKNISYIGLNIPLYCEQLKSLSELFLHEYCHVKFDDNFQKELLQNIAMANSHDDISDVAQQCAPFCRAFEVRADVYVAVNSPYNGRHLTEFLKSLPDETIITHPKLSERVTLLEAIRSELDSCAS